MTNEEIRAKIAENRKKACEIDMRPVLYLTETEYNFLQNTISHLSRALDKAIEILNWDCPVSQDLINDLDCENNCTSDFEECSKKCWRKYLLSEAEKK